ncbi:dimethylargininase [Amycolatopsis alba]|uniref:Amidinotransferase n=1 Tax=Amycolatopsis alba DSM 44262 TaxID=1125972 RepID=A0A229RW58_AMYAL|nr:dimethylargininase [Amycolatopsis alba]OXM50765.1 amidinotransferase [Amycolatopsis alba DSM 44262]
MRHYLMVSPAYFAVEYSINPWMDPGKPTDTKLAITQWEWLRDLYVELGHRVDLLDPVPGLPDMVYAANGATVVNGRALVARFRHRHRRPESAAHLKWFTEHGYPDVQQAKWDNEGEGDFLVAGSRILAGSGFRTDPRAHAEAAEFFGVPVVGLALTDPRYYHLDTALTVLDDDMIMYFPDAFTEGSRRRLKELYPDAVLASATDAAAFGLNAVSDGRHVILPQAATGVIAQLRERGFEPIGADLSELLKGGGSVKCCTLELLRGKA